MVRFRLKTEFLTYAHNQIRGGLWYRPTWWTAVSAVPPAAVLPRVKKRDVPRIRFLEDRLMREFTARNPALRAVDARNYARGRTSSVAAEFVSEQLRHMRGEASEAESYAAASSWLVASGPAVLRRVDAKLLGDGDAPLAGAPPRDSFDRVMAQQTELLREALQQEEAARTGKAQRELPPLRSFLSGDELAAIAARTAHRAAPLVGATAAAAAARRGGGSGGAPDEREHDADEVRGAVSDSAEADAVVAEAEAAAASGRPLR